MECTQNHATPVHWYALEQEGCICKAAVAWSPGGEHGIFIIPYK
jgi:hypothetical protein